MTKTVNLSTSVPSVTFVKTGLLVPDEIDILNGRLSDLSTALGGQMSTSLTSPQGQIAVSDSAIIADKNDQLLAIVNQINPDYASGRFQDAIGRIYFLDRTPASGTTVTAKCTGMVGSCVSKPPAPCVKPLPPAAWATQEPHNLQKQLDKIIMISSE